MTLSPIQHKYLYYILLLIAFTAGVAVAAWLAQEKEASDFNPYADLGGNFTLNSADGAVSLQDYRGKIVTLYFGFTSCPDICPSSLALLASALNGLTTKENQQIQALFVSLDPQRDNLTKLKQYAVYFHPDMLGLTANKTTLDKIVKQYGAYYQVITLDDSALNYTLDHSSRIYIIDQTGQLRSILKHDTNPEEIKTHIRSLL